MLEVRREEAGRSQSLRARLALVKSMDFTLSVIGNLLEPEELLAHRFLRKVEEARKGERARGRAGGRERSY